MGVLEKCDEKSWEERGGCWQCGIPPLPSLSPPSALRSAGGYSLRDSHGFVQSLLLMDSSRLWPLLTDAGRGLANDTFESPSSSRVVAIYFFRPEPRAQKAR